MFKSGICIAMFVGLLEFVVSISDENKLIIQSVFVTAGEKCVADHTVTEEEITAFKERKFPEGKGAACFSACVLTNIGLLDDKGNLSSATALHEAIAKSDNEEIKSVQEFLINCAKEAETKHEDGCERAKHTFECFAEKAEKFDF